MWFFNHLGLHVLYILVNTMELNWMLLLLSRNPSIVISPEMISLCGKTIQYPAFISINVNKPKLYQYGYNTCTSYLNPGSGWGKWGCSQVPLSHSAPWFSFLCGNGPWWLLLSLREQWCMCVSCILWKDIFHTDTVVPHELDDKMSSDAVRSTHPAGTPTAQLSSS